MMINLLKEVGRGKRGARDLTYEEALQAAEAILGRDATDAQIGAFLIAERIKMESVEELEAFVAVCRKYALREPVLEGGIDCAGPYDGRKSSFFATFATAFVLASSGLPVTLHGTSSLPPKRGITMMDMMKHMGIDAARLSREASLRAARQTGILFVPSELWCPPLKRLRHIREELGMRTVINTAEKLVDYSHSPYLAFGVFHNTVFDRMARLMTKLGYRKAIIVQGAEGSEDLFVNRPTRVYIVSGGEAEMKIVDPEEYGLDTPLPDTEWTAAGQVRVLEDVLRGVAELGYLNQTLLNAAVRLHLAGRAGSVEEGLYISKANLESGKALRLYEQWRSALAGGDGDESLHERHAQAAPQSLHRT
jgi:Anthranilate phosphoribosyltransferase